MSLPAHIGQLVLFAIIVVGPIPLAVALANQSGREVGRHSRTHQWLAAAVTWAATQTVLGLLLGLAGRLSLYPTLASEAVCFLLGAAILIGARERSSQRDPDVRSPGARSLRLSEVSVIAGIGTVALAFVHRCLSQPPRDWDSLAYHLPTMAAWHQTERLGVLPVEHAASRYPLNWHALCSLLLLPFREDFAVTLPNLLGWAVLGLAVYRLSVTAGATRVQGAASACLLLTIPLLLRNINTMHVDVPFAALFMSALYFGVVPAARPSPARLVLVLGATGMLVGMRTSGLVYALLLLAAIVPAWLRRTREGRVLQPSRIASPALVVTGLAAFLLLGGFWYVRNYIELGNPLGLFAIRLGGAVVFPGSLDYQELARKSSLAHLFEPANMSHWGILARQVNVRLGFQFLTLASMACLVPLGLLLRRGPARGESIARVAILLVATALVYWTSPWTAASAAQGWKISAWLGGPFRYAFPSMGLLAVAAAVGGRRFRIGDELVAVLAFIAVVAALSEAGAMLLLAPLLLAITAYALASRRPARASSPESKRERPDANVSVNDIRPANGPSGGRWKRVARGASAAIIVAVILISGTYVARRQRCAARASAFGGITSYVDAQLARDEAIGCLVMPWPYLLYGTNLDRRVLLDVPTGANSPAEWADLLRARKIALLAVGPIRGEHLKEEAESTPELDWLRQERAPFRKVLGDDLSQFPALYWLQQERDTRTP